MQGFFVLHLDNSDTFARSMKVSYSIIAVLFITLFAGCKQDFDITANYKELPVVYGLLNQQDNVHYVRIQKGYLIDGNANLAAGVIDSIYYTDSLIVKLVPYLNGSVSGTPILLHKIDGNLIGLPKDSGLFANSPNILYATDNNVHLSDTKTYKLQVIRSSDTLVITQTNLVKDFQVITPTKGAKLNLQNTSASPIRWYDAENGGVYDLTVRFFYTEYKLSDGTFYKNDSIDIPFLRSYVSDYVAGHRNDEEFTEDVVLKYLAAHITSDIEVTREFNVLKGMQFMFAVGGTALDSFYLSKLAQGGLASNEALPPYTNINTGRNVAGAGLFSSRYFKQVDSVLLSNNALDSLACNEFSRGLRFKNHAGVICQ